MKQSPSLDAIKATVETLFAPKAGVERVYEGMSSVFRCSLEDGSEVYLKTAPGGEAGWIRRERVVLKVMAKYNLSVPRVLFTEEDLPDRSDYIFMITEKVPGTPLNELEDIKDRPAAFYGMGKCLADLQAIEAEDLFAVWGEGGETVILEDQVPFSQHVKDVTERGHLNDLYRPVPMLIGELDVQEEFGWIQDMHSAILTEETYGIAHGDYAPRHFFFHQGRTMGLDLMTLSVGFPFRDLGKARVFLLWGDRHHDAEAYEWLIEGYTNGEGLNEQGKLQADIGFVAEALELARLYHRNGNHARKETILRELMASPVVEDLRS